MSVSRLAKNRERSLGCIGDGPGGARPDCRSSSAKLRAASASPTVSAVHARPLGLSAIAPHATQRAASGTSAVTQTSPGPMTSAMWVVGRAEAGADGERDQRVGRDRHRRVGHHLDAPGVALGDLVGFRLHRAGRRRRCRGTCIAEPCEGLVTTPVRRGGVKPLLRLEPVDRVAVAQSDQFQRPPAGRPGSRPRRSGRKSGPG